MKVDIDRMRAEAKKSPCSIIKFSASNGEFYSHNGEFFSDCENCERDKIEQSHPQCKANHAEWSLLSKARGENGENIWIYCMTPDGKDYPFKRFWCQTCAILLPMFGIKNVYMWDCDWIHHNADTLIDECNEIDNGVEFHTVDTEGILIPENVCRIKMKTAEFEHFINVIMEGHAIIHKFNGVRYMLFSTDSLPTIYEEVIDTKK